MKETIRQLLLETGASAVGFSQAGEIDPEIADVYSKWLEEGNHGEMFYLERHNPLRQNTESVLPGSRTVISIAYSYVPEEWLPTDRPLIAAYAYGEDYHKTLRDLLKPVVAKLTDQFGGKWRICIDSAPISERYWAMKSGIGKKGRNGSVIVDGCGSLCFLVEILSTLEIEPDQSSEAECDKCGMCIDSCPAHALRENGTVNAQKCINYLTIEKKGDFTEEEATILKSGNGYLFGCDRCLRICPYNKKTTPSRISAFQLKENISMLGPDTVLSMDEETFKKIFSDSPLLYAGYPKLKRNASLIKKSD